MIKGFFKYIFRPEFRREKNINFIAKNNYKFFFKIICSFMRMGLARKNVIVSKKSKIGSNLKVPHPQNIIIGPTSIGDNCTIYQDVTIGQNKGGYPKIGNNVIIYSGAKIVGDISIGDNCIIGCNAVVVKNFEACTIVGGVPAKKIKMRSDNDEYY